MIKPPNRFGLSVKSFNSKCDYIYMCVCINPYTGVEIRNMEKTHLDRIQRNPIFRYLDVTVAVTNLY